MIVITSLFLSLFLCPGIHNFENGWLNAVLPSDDSTHYSMTECALLEKVSEYLKLIYNITSVESTIQIQYGRCQTKPIYEAIYSELNRLKIDKKRLSSAIETIAESNRQRDLFEAFNDATHFQNEQFDEGALLISQRFDAAISSMKIHEYEKARESFGALLHTVQDFYSHSNWIEIGHREPNKGIGQYEKLGKYASKEMRTCLNCRGESCRMNIDPFITKNNILTSGYWSLKIIGQLINSNPKPKGKCSHGGLLDSTTETDATGDGINKDTLSSAHGHLHTTAASVAYNATKQILNQFWEKIDDQLFGQFLGLSENLRNLSSNSLIIAMDTTGSMGPYIDMAKQIAIGIVDIYQTLEYKPSNYILSPFNDPTWGPLTVSHSPQEFTKEIGNLSATGGGDTPELFYHGIVDALKACEIGSNLYAFTDAPAKDAHLKSLAVQLAKEKRVTVTLFYARSILRIQQNSYQSAVKSDVIEDLIIGNGSDLSSITGGVIMGINAQSLNATENYIINRLDESKMKTIIHAKAFNNNFTFHVDPSIKSLRIEITSSMNLLVSRFFLIKPSGEVFSPVPISQTQYILIYTIPIENSSIGEWTMTSQMNVNHYVQVNAISNIACSSTLQKQIFDSSSNTSFASLTSQPIQNEKDLFVLTICENLPSNIRTGHTYLIDANNGSNILEKLIPIQIFPTGFLSKLTVPKHDFRLSTVVHLQNGSIIQRQDKPIISPTSISLTIDNQPYRVLLNDTLVISYTIYNHGQVELNVILRITDVLGILSNSSISKSYKIDGMNHTSDKIEMHATNITGMNLSSNMITNTIMFSVAALNYEYSVAAPIYIQRKSTPLTEQSHYQKPPPIYSGANQMKRFTNSMLFIFLFTRFPIIYK